MTPFLAPLAPLSLTAWWPVRAVLLAGLIAVIVVLLWRARRWPSRLALTTAAIALLGANVLAAVNAYYGYFLTVGQAMGMPGQDSTSLIALDHRGPPPEGIVVGIDIPSGTSRFHPRTTQVYLPPAWFARPRPELPVVLLLHGTPGAPTDWIDGGRAEQTLNDWVSTHDGVAPIVVMPDINGSFTADSECVNGPAGDVETYLTVTLPDFVHDRFRTAPPGRNWAVAGLSEGGSCALMLALRHPGLFQTFGDYGGLAGPREGDSNAVGDTVETLFGGSSRNFDAHEPAYLLTHERYPLTAGWFEVGSDDHEPLLAARFLSTLATRAGISTHLVVVPGASHTFALWSAAFAQSLPWMISHLGLPTPSHHMIMASVRPFVLGKPMAPHPNNLHRYQPEPLQAAHPAIRHQPGKVI